MEKRLYRSRTDYLLAGVCGGIGEYLSIDPVFVRVFFIVITLADGIGALIYLLLWFIIPRTDKSDNTTIESFYTSKEEISSKAQEMGDEFRQAARHYNKDTSKYIGIAFIAAGCVYFLKETMHFWIPQMNSNVLWSLLLIAGGSILLWRTLKK